MKSERGVVSVFVCLLTLVVAIIVWSTVNQNMREGKVFRTALDKGEADWCFEFWLNRYQALLTGIVAIGAVLAAALQWNETRSHTASLRRSILLEKKSALTALSLGALGAKLRIGALFDVLAVAPTSGDQGQIAEVWNGPMTIWECRAAIVRALQTGPASEMTERKAILVATSLDRFAEIVSRHFRGETLDLFVADETERRAQAERLKRAFAEFDRRANDLIEEIGAELARLRREIDAAEAKLGATPVQAD